MKLSSISNTGVQRCLYPLFHNQGARFLLSPLFERISQPSGQDQRNDEFLNFVNYYSSTSQLTQEYTLSYFFGLLRRLFFQNIFYFFSSETAYSTYSRKLPILLRQCFLKIYLNFLKGGGKDRGLWNSKND